MTEFKNVTKSYSGVSVIDNFSLILKKNEPVALMGGSGKGKTTLLRIAAGLEVADSGEFVTDGEKIAYMFQEPRLLPWKNALDNVKLPLRKESLALAEKYFEAVGLSLENDSKKLPRELSGGMAQRVAFARFLAYAEESQAELLILDEPFSALDEEMSVRLSQLLVDFSRDKMLLIVTHDRADVKSLGATEIMI